MSQANSRLSLAQQHLGLLDRVRLPPPNFRVHLHYGGGRGLRRGLRRPLAARGQARRQPHLHRRKRGQRAGHKVNNELNVVGGDADAGHGRDQRRRGGWRGLPFHGGL